jgi:hypothetical protein
MQLPHISHLIGSRRPFIADEALRDKNKPGTPEQLHDSGIKINPVHPSSYTDFIAVIAFPNNRFH